MTWQEYWRKDSTVIVDCTSLVSAVVVHKGNFTVRESIRRLLSKTATKLPRMKWIRADQRCATGSGVDERAARMGVEDVKPPRSWDPAGREAATLPARIPAARSHQKLERTNLAGSVQYRRAGDSYLSFGAVALPSVSGTVN